MEKDFGYIGGGGGTGPCGGSDQIGRNDEGISYTDYTGEFV